MARLLLSAVMAGCVLIASQGASAQAVFKCKAADGSSYFTDKACPTGNAGSVELNATQAGIQSRIDDVTGRTARRVQEAQEANFQNEAAADIRERASRAERARSDAASAESIRATQTYEARQQLENAARSAKLNANVADWANGSPAERRAAHEAASDLGEQAAMGRPYTDAELSAKTSARQQRDLAERARDNQMRQVAAEADAVNAQAQAQVEQMQAQAAAVQRQADSSRTITNCGGAGCYDNNGDRYTQIGPTIHRSDGKTCVSTGDGITMRCE